MDLPNYTKDQLKDWIFSQPNWEELYSDWVKSDYAKNKTPSVDRLDDYKPYTLNNIRLVTWLENNQRAHYDMAKNINDKKSVKVNQYSESGKFIKTHDSMKLASIDTKANSSCISACCRGADRKMTGGYQWRYFEGSTEDINPFIKAIPNKKNNGGKRIVQTDIDENEIHIFGSKAEACSELGISMKPINKCINNPDHSFKGWKFRLENPEDLNREKKDLQINKYELDGTYIETFKNIKEVNRVTGIQTSSITMVCQGRHRFKAGGFMWKYNRNVPMGENIKPIEESLKPIDVHCYDLDGKYIRTYKSMSFASSELGITCSCVSQSCRKISRAENYMFRFASDYEPNVNIEPYDTEIVYDPTKPLK